MKRAALVIVLAGVLPVAAQDEGTVSVDEAIQAARDFAKDNLDERVLRALPELDEQKVKELLASLQREFGGKYVLDLAQLKEAAGVMVPLLERSEDTRPYAVWLKNRLDYLEAADELARRSRLPKIEPGKPPPPPPNPPAQQERDLWNRRLSRRPVPPGAAPLVAELKPIFAREKVPAQFVWLAEVESSFDARARSPAGAAGLFQLMPATAKRFGLRTWPFDQRLDAPKSGRAAAEYLRRLHARFKDWRLALAAYNAGEGTVQNLLDRHKAKTYDAIATQLPAETQLYVPKVEAVVLRREGIKLDQLQPAGH